MRANSYQLTPEGREGGRPMRPVVSVLNDTKRIADYDTRVVRSSWSRGLS